MIETIKINVPEGKKAVYDEATQTIKFVDIALIRSKSWAEFCKNHPNAASDRYIDPFGKIFQWDAYNRNSKCLLKNREDAEGILALIQLIRLHDEWVGSWEPDYKGKWFHSIYYYQNYIDVFDNRYNHNLLSFPTKEMAKEFLNCFKDLLEKAKRFI